MDVKLDTDEIIDQIRDINLEQYEVKNLLCAIVDEASNWCDIHTAIVETVKEEFDSDNLEILIEELNKIQTIMPMWRADEGSHHQTAGYERK